MKPLLTEKTIRQFVNEISDQHYVMTEAVIAAVAAQAAALGEACMQISLDNQVDKLDWHDVTARIEQMSHIKNTLLEWCNQEISPIVNYIESETTNNLINNQQELCDYPAEIGRFSIEAALMLQNFRPLIFNPIRHDLEMAVSMLAGTAQTAILLLEGNLYRYPSDALLREYEPLRDELCEQLELLTVVRKIEKV